MSEGGLEAALVLSNPAELCLLGPDRSAEVENRICCIISDSNFLQIFDFPRGVFFISPCGSA